MDYEYDAGVLGGVLLHQPFLDAIGNPKGVYVIPMITASYDLAAFISAVAIAPFTFRLGRRWTISTATQPPNDSLKTIANRHSYRQHCCNYRLYHPNCVILGRPAHYWAPVHRVCDRMCELSGTHISKRNRY